MEDQLSLLWQLQTLEQQCACLERKKSMFPRQEVSHVEQEMTLCQQQILCDQKKARQLQQVCDAKETELSTETAKFRNLEKMLYSDQPKSLKEIEQLQNQCDNARNVTSQLESSYFATVDESDALHKKLLANEQLLKKKAVQHEQLQTQMADELATLEMDIFKLRNQCQSLLAILDSALKEKYMTLKRHLATPVALIKNQICGGCRMGLPESVSASRENSLTYCDHCGRILIEVKP